MSRPVRVLQWKDASDEAALHGVVRAAGKKESEVAQALKTSINTVSKCNTVSKWTRR